MPELLSPKELILILFAIGKVIFAWWWLWLPIILFKPAIYFWLWWRQEIWDAKQKSILLELKLPGNIEKPFIAMENVFASLWQTMHDPPDTVEKWFEGKGQASITLEIASIEGEIHFYIRVPKEKRGGVEAAIYAQFSDVEFEEVEDYAKHVPNDIPNKEWNLWGTNYRFKKTNVYPIKTYSRFFEPRAETPEEAKVDPMALLLEGLSRIGRGEQIWMQYILSPITPEDDYDYVAEGRAEIDRIVDERFSGKTTSVKQQKAPGWFDDIRNAANMIFGLAPITEESKQEERKQFSSELTQGERDITLAIEQKISRYAFMASVRFIYLAKRENYFGPAKSYPMAYFTQFSTQNLNGLRPLNASLTKVSTVFLRFLDKRRTFLKKRRLFRNYTRRVPPFFPKGGGTVLLNTEELATLFHFPGKLTAPTAPFERITARRGGAPPELPSEGISPEFLSE